MYAVNSPRVLYERMEDNIILIDGISGLYYSLGGLGARIFLAMAEGAGKDEIVKTLLGTGAAFSFEPEDALERFLRELLDNHILILSDAAAGSSAPPVLSASAEDEAPQLVKFDDLQELLLIDPIHQVDIQEGWPYGK